MRIWPPEILTKLKMPLTVRTTRKKDSLSTKKNSEKTSSEQTTETNKETKIEKAKCGFGAKFDFVPGDTVIFENGPSADEENGEFPSRWDLVSGQVELQIVDGEPVIMFIDGYPMIVPYLKNSNRRLLTLKFLL